MTIDEARKFVLSIYPNAYLGFVGGNTIVFPEYVPENEMHSCVTYIGAGWHKTCRYRIVEEAWIDAAQKIQKKMVEKLES